MGCFRIYVGNLPNTVSAEELKSKFETFCSRVGDELEIKNKNESTFAYLNLYNDDTEGHNRHREAPIKFEELPNNIQKCIAVMNNTKWKGNLIKVQLAKESFLSKLKKEQQGYKGDSNKRNDDHIGKGEVLATNERPAFHHNEQSSKLLALAGMPSIPPELNDRRIDERSRPASVGCESMRSSKFSPKKIGEDNDRDSASTSSKLLALAGMVPLQFPRKIHGEHRNNEQTKSETYDFEIVSATFTATTNGINNKRKAASSSDSSDSETEVKEGFIPKFRGLLHSFPDDTLSNIQKQAAESSTLKIHAISIKENEKANKPGIKFNPLKKQKSNDLRLKSMENRLLQEKRKTDVIKHSLKQINAPTNFETQPAWLSAETAQKIDKPMELFNGDVVEDVDVNFNIKKQFEGESGQKLLELKSKWNFDERFNIDERFKDDEENFDGKTEEDGTNIQKEKAGEMGILSQMFGSEVLNKSSKEGKNSKSNSDFVIIPRYDPDLEDSKEKYKSKDEHISKQSKEKFKVHKDKTSSELSKFDKVVTVADPESVKKAEYKVADNLKSLFSNESSSKSKPGESNSFSLLSAFGSNTNDEQHTFLKDTIHTTSKDEPRKFWQSNPFKYDSSDDEEESETKKIANKKPTAYVPLAKKDFFFFTSKDPRFNCIEKFFLVPDEDLDTVNKNFNDVDRAELKSLIKAKIKNTKRKSDKRDEALKRLRRKQKLKKKQTTKSNKKKFAMKQ